MRKSNFALRLQPSLLDEARKVAEAARESEWIKPSFGTSVSEAVPS